jgi:hypothetical protein
MMRSLAATPAALFLPSRSTYISMGKLALIGMLVTTFFLFTSAYNFPGGASHYPNWAEAIVHGTKLPPTVAQREVGFPLLYILGGFTFTHSFIGITLILAVFAILMSLLVCWCLADVSSAVGYYMGLACIVSLAPFTYLKFFYPDQAYMFFNLLTVALLVKFIQSKGNFRLLYLFTLTAIVASFMRTAGNLMYPVLLAIAYFSVRGRLRHYLSCILIFSLAAGLYQWHRYDIFDMRNQPTIPSGKGMQILYSTYLYLGDFGLRLSPDFGPNTKRLFERMREELGSNVRESPLIQKGLGATPPDFMEKNFYAYTPEQLIEEISTKPNEEYYWNVVYAVDTNDQFFLNVAKEIMRSNPWYVVQYSMRNLRHALFDPGYATTRYNTFGYGRMGKEFVPSAVGWGTYSEDPVTQYGSRAVKEMQYNPLKTTPSFIQKFFSNVELFHLKNYDRYISITTVLILAAWLAAGLGLLSRFFSHTKFFQPFKKMGIDKLAAPIIAVSALVIYEDLLTSLFCQPVYRYFHMTEPLRLVIVGFGVIFLTTLLSYRLGPNFGQPIKSFISSIQKYDLLEGYFAPRRKQWIFFLLSVNVILFVWWVSSMIAHTT